MGGGREDEADLRVVKAELRREMIALREAIPLDERNRASRRIQARVLALPELVGEERIFVFVSHGSEVATRPLIDALLARGLALSVPRVVDRTRMIAAAFSGWESLVEGVLGILAPDTLEPDPIAPDVVITPGLAFTPAGDRLGYGRGYYDRWFQENPGPVRVAVAYESQIVDTLPVHEKDEPVDLIVTEERVLSTKRRRRF